MICQQESTRTKSTQNFLAISPFLRLSSYFFFWRATYRSRFKGQYLRFADKLSLSNLVTMESTSTN